MVAKRSRSQKQETLVFALSEGKSKQEAARIAGYKSAQSASRLVNSDFVKSEVLRINAQRLFAEILPLAVTVHLDLLQNPLTPAGVRAQAVKLAYDQTFSAEMGGSDKQPHEMTPEELATALQAARLRHAALETAAAGNAKDVTPEPGDALEPDLEPETGDIFG